MTLMAADPTTMLQTAKTLTQDAVTQIELRMCVRHAAKAAAYWRPTPTHGCVHREAAVGGQGLNQSLRSLHDSTHRLARVPTSGARHSGRAPGQKATDRAKGR